MTAWERAQHLRRIAVNAPTREQAKKLYAIIRALEKGYLTEQNNGEPRTLPETPLRRDGEQETSELPRWFRDAKRAIRCSKCNGKRGVWWYRREVLAEQTNYKRVRILARIRRGAFDSAKELMNCSVTICRECIP